MRCRTTSPAWTSSSSGAASRTSPRGSRARGARPVGVDPTPAQLETARRCQRETGIEFPLVEAFGEAVPLPDDAFDLVLSEYGASIWADPYRVDSRGGAAPARPAGVLVFLRNSTLSILCSPDVGPDRRAARAAAVRHAPVRLARGRRRHRVPSRARRLGPAAARERLRDPRPDRDPGARRRGDARVLRLRSRRSGRSSGRARRSGSRARRRCVERAARAAAAARVDVAAAARDPRSSWGSRSTSSRRATRSTIRRRRTRPSSCASTRAGRRSRSRARPTAGPCSASTRRSCSAAASTRKPANAGEAERMLEELSGRTHAVVSGLCLIAPGLGGRRGGRDARHVPRADAARPRPLRRVGRVGGPRRRLCDPGPRRRTRRADRGRLPERRRPAGRAARAAAGGALPRHLRLRLALPPAAAAARRRSSPYDLVVSAMPGGP